MSRPTARNKILVGSVQRLLDPGERVRDVIVMFSRHRWFVPYSIVAASAVFLVASTSGIAGTLNRVVLAACGMAIAGMATTNYWVLADTTSGLVLCRSSRVRQFARAIVDRLPADTTLDMVTSNVITSEWRVGEMMYTLTKRSEAVMRELSTRGGNEP